VGISFLGLLLKKVKLYVIKCNSFFMRLKGTTKTKEKLCSKLRENEREVCVRVCVWYSRKRASERV